MLDAFIFNQGLLSVRRLKLLCIPDYFFFRTHSQKLYREYQGIPRYSIISRKITDQFNNKDHKEESSSLDTIYVVDGVSGLQNVPFFFQLAKKLNISVIGSILDFSELYKLRYVSLPIQDFNPFEPRIIASTEVKKQPAFENKKLESKSVILPITADLYVQKPRSYITNNSIAIGTVRDLNDFFPSNFDVLRINLGDFVEYGQVFDYTNETADYITRNRKICILDEVKKIITLFNIQIVLVSLYKLIKFLSLTKDSSISIANQIHDICNYWSFSNSILIHNEKRMVWEQEPLTKIEDFFDAHGYLLFHR